MPALLVETDQAAAAEVGGAKSSPKLLHRTARSLGVSEGTLRWAEVGFVERPHASNR